MSVVFSVLVVKHVYISLNSPCVTVHTQYVNAKYLYDTCTYKCVCVCVYIVDLAQLIVFLLQALM